MAAPTISAVIPNWNGLEFLKVVLPSLKAQTFQDFEVIVVDNGSEDQSVTYLEKQWPDVRIVRLSENQGFAGAINHGLKAAGGELLAVLNNDLELAPDWLARMRAAAAEHPDCGMFGGKLLQYDDRAVIDGTGETLSWFATTLKRGHGERDTGQYDTPGYVFSPNAAAIVYRRSMLDRIGTFDADFFAYIEDSDLHLRAQLAGFKAWYDPGAVGYHMGGKTSGRLPKRFLFTWHRNRVWLVLKNFPISRILRHLPGLVFANAKTLLGGIKHRELGTVLRAWSAAWLALPAVLRKRRRIQRTKRVSNAYLDSIISNSFGEPSRLLELFKRRSR